MTRELSRRTFIASTVIAAAGVLAAPVLLTGRASARVLIVGGGPGGVTAAGTIRTTLPEASILLVERDPGRLVRNTTTQLISGRPDPGDYGALAAQGIDIVLDDISTIDWQAGRAMALSGRAFSFDRIVLAPGIAFRDEGIAGYDRETARLFPHGWTDRSGVDVLAAEIRAMPDGGSVLIRIPPGRMRYPEGAYRRAGEIAGYLADAKPRSRVVILDQGAPDRQRQSWQNALTAAYGDRIAYVSGAVFGDVQAIDAANRTLIGTRSSLSGDVINFIPAQSAGRIAEVSQLTDASGWCPTTTTGQSLRQSNAFLVSESQCPNSDDTLAGQAAAAKALAAALARMPLPPKA